MPAAGESSLESLLAEARQVFEHPTAESLQRIVASLERALAEPDPAWPAEQHGTAWARLADAANLMAGQRLDATIYEKALDGYAKAVELTPRGILRDKFQLNQLMALDGYARLKSDLAATRDVYRQIREVVESFGEDTEPAIRISAQERLAVSEMSQGASGGDLSLLERSLDRFEQLQSLAEEHQFHQEAMCARINQGLARKSIGELCGDPGPLRHAVETLESAAADLSAEEQPDLWARALLNLGQAEVRLGEFLGDRKILWRAIATFDRCQQVWSRDALPSRWADLQQQRALPLQILGELAEDPSLLVYAVASYDAAIAALSPEANAIGWAIAHMNKGNALRSLGEAGDDTAWQQAREAYEVALAVYEQTEAPVRRIKTRANMAVAELFAGLRHRDVATLQRAESHLFGVWELCNREEEAQLWAGLRVFRGRIALALGDLTGDRAPLERARTWFDEAQTVFAPEKISGDWIGLQMNLAQVEARLGDWPAVAARIEPLLEHTFTAVVTAGTWQAQNEILKLIRGVADLDALVRLRLGDPEGAWQRLFAGRGILRAAQRASETMLGSGGGQAGELRRARAAWIDASNAVELAQRLAASAEPPAGAAAELRRAAQHLAAADETLKGLQPTLEQATQRHGGTPARPAAGTAWAALLVTDLGGAVLLRQSVGDIQARELPRLSTAAMETLLSGPTTALGSAEPLLVGFTGWLPAYQRFKAAGLHPSNRALHAWNDAIGLTLDALWQIFAEDLEAALGQLSPAPQEFVLLPPGRMAVLPLQGARRPDGNGGFVHLGDRWPLAVAPDPASLPPALQAVTPPAGRRRLLAVSPLAAKPEEIPAWQSFAEDSRHCLCGAEAGLDAVCAAAASVDYVSLLCHGVSDPERPDRSGLELADARLTLSRIRRLDLSGTRLVCLTACESGLIETRMAPDEFHGLPSDLLAAGTPAVAATLWMVDRETAGRLTESFFAAHLGGKAPAAALRDAQQSFRRGAAPPALPGGAVQAGAELLGFGGTLDDDEHDRPPLPPDAPFYWAGFVVYGL